jgi:hypothetical protein
MPSNNSYASSVSKEAPEDSSNGPKLPTDAPAPASSTGAETESNNQRGTEDQSETVKEADRLYEERIEEEYAKREGGA